MADWIGLAESAYALDGDLDDWLAGICDRAAPLLDLGLGVAAYTFKVTPTSLEGDGIATRGGPGEFADSVRNAMIGAGPAGVKRFLGAGTSVHTMSEWILEPLPEEHEGFRAATSGEFQDVLGVLVFTGRGYGLSLAIPLDTPRAPTPPERRHLGRIGAHLGAGMRLRGALSREIAVEPEAVLDPDGKVRDAQGEAVGREPRERLREAVRRLERARTRANRSDPESLELWEGLVRGRWSLVDRFESDGRRFIVAHRNAPELGDPRGLTKREHHVAERVGRGSSNKEIAYELGISESSVANAVASTRRKLGLQSRIDLAAFFAPGGLRSQLTAYEIAGETLAVGVAERVDTDALAQLTDAEQEVTLHLMSGATNAEISRRRSTSENTTANQVKSIYERLGVDSRSALAARLAKTGDGS